MKIEELMTFLIFSKKKKKKTNNTKKLHFDCIFTIISMVLTIVNEFSNKCICMNLNF